MNVSGKTAVWPCLLVALGALAQEDPGWKKTFLITRAGDAYAKGRYEEAQKLFRSVLQLDPDDDTALLHLGAMAKREKKLAEAASFLGRGAKAHPKSFPLQAEYGGVLLAMGRPAEAAPYFKAAATANPESLDALVNYGDALSLSGRREEAWAPYQAAVKLVPTSAWARRQAGFCAYDTGRLPEALEHLTAAAPGFPKDFNVPLVIGHANAKLGNDGAALEAYQRVTVLAPKNESGPLFAGTAYARMGRLLDARNSLERAVALKPDSDVARVHLGNLYRQLKQIHRAREQYTRAIEIAPRSVWALIQLGFLELEAGHAGRAKVLLRRAAAIDPTNADVGVALGDAYQLLKQDAEALKAYQGTLARHPTHLAALVKSADVRRKTDLTAAVALYQQAVKLHPKSAWARISYGDALRMGGDSRAAKEQYQAALLVDPNSRWGQRQLGYADFELGEDEEAEKLLSAMAAEGDADLFLVLGHLAKRRRALDEALHWYEKARAQEPKRPQTLLAIADVLNERGEVEAAEVEVRGSLTLDAGLIDAWILLGDIKRRLVNGAKDEEMIRPALLLAKEAYERALSIDGKHARATRQLGTLAHELGDDVIAASLLAQARKSYPDDGELSLVAGHVATRLSSVQDAQLAYLDATKQLHADVRPWVFAGRATLRLEKYSEAEALFQKALEIAPESGWAHLEQGYGRRARRDWGAALISAEAATRFDERNPEAWLFLGRLHQERNRLDRAVEAYEKARLLAPQSLLADRALASALAHRGKVEDLMRAELLMEGPLKALSDEGFTYAVAGYVMVKLARTAEPFLPAPQAPQTREKRRAVWKDLGVFYLQEAVKRAPTDRHLRLASALGLSELGRAKETLEILEPLLEPGQRTCPQAEGEWTWNALGTPKPLELARTPEEVLALEDEQLRSEAHLLAGDVAPAENSQAARLRYFCSLVWFPWRADAHLRLGASYEALGLIRLAEEHFSAATRLEPGNAAALASLARIRKEGGIPVGPVRVSGLTSFASELVPADVQARLARSTGASGPDAERALLTTPRAWTVGAEATWQRPQWDSKLRLGAGYAFSWGINSFLNDQLAFEDRQSHLVDVFASGRPILFKDRRFESWWRAGYRLTVANSASRAEFRNALALEARVLRDGWGTAQAELAYAFGRFSAMPGSVVADPTAHGLVFGVRVNPLWRKYDLLLSAGYRGQFASLVPSGRALWVNEIDADLRKFWGRIFIGADARLGHSSDAPWASPGAAVAFSGMIRGMGGYRWNAYSGLLGRAGVALAAGASQFDSVLLGLHGEHRFVFRGFGDADQGLSVSAGYDLRHSYGLNHVEHLFTAVATLGQ